MKLTNDKKEPKKKGLNRLCNNNNNNNNNNNGLKLSQYMVYIV